MNEFTNRRGLILFLIYIISNCHFSFSQSSWERNLTEDRWFTENNGQISDYEGREVLYTAEDGMYRVYLSQEGVFFERTSPCSQEELKEYREKKEKGEHPSSLPTDRFGWVFSDHSDGHVIPGKKLFHYSTFPIAQKLELAKEVDLQAFLNQI